MRRMTVDGLRPGRRYSFISHGLSKTVAIPEYPRQAYHVITGIPPPADLSTCRLQHPHPKNFSSGVVVRLCYQVGRGNLFTARVSRHQS